MEFKQICLLTVVTVFAGAVWSAGHYRIQAQAWRRDAETSKTSARLLGLTLDKLQLQQKAMSELDQHYTEQLNEAENKNVTLRRQLAAGTRRMYLRTRKTGAGAERGTTSGGMGYATGIRLSADAGQAVLSVRGGIIRDREKIAYLQDYIRQVCQGATPADKSNRRTP